METDQASLSYLIQRKPIVDTIYVENLLSFFSEFQVKSNPIEVRKKRVIDDDDEDNENIDKAGKLITDIAARCSKLSRVESSKSSNPTKEVLDVSLDAIKRQYGVDPNLMRDCQSALENEAKFKNPTNAYMNIQERSYPINDTIQSIQPSPRSLPVGRHDVKDMSLNVASPQLETPTKPLTFMEKNQMMSDKWKKQNESQLNSLIHYSLPLKQHSVNISVTYRNFEDGGVITRPYHTFVNWYVCYFFSLDGRVDTS